jgi:hypothetical protein
MAGLPWLFVFSLLAWLGMSRGWFWLTVLSFFCMGMAAADTALGTSIYSSFTGIIVQAWHAVLQLTNSAAR